MKTEI